MADIGCCTRNIRIDKYLLDRGLQEGGEVATKVVQYRLGVHHFCHKTFDYKKNEHLNTFIKYNGTLEKINLLDQRLLIKIKQKVFKQKVFKLNKKY